MTETFEKVLTTFQLQYQHRDIHMRGTMVYIDGKEKFNVDGWNDLYNIKRLCDCLEDELL